jgi:RNA polymerase sigma-70 factor (ECF subfamily)
MNTATTPIDYTSEDNLIPALIRQDEAAFRFAIKQYQGPMFALAQGIVGMKIADEVVQEAWFSVMKSIAKFQLRSALKSWILTIVANEAKTRLRKEKREVSLEALTGDDPDMQSRFDDAGHWGQPPSDWQVDSPETLLSTRQLKSCLDHTIGLLPALQGTT